MSLRNIAEIIASVPTVEGAGVLLRRAFGFGKTSEFDPFLLFDDFRGESPDDYQRGFPWHPHRGIETITYVLAGTVEHRDSLGNRGMLHSGDLQWMTAGHGIIHQEMPVGDQNGRMHGFQLWANLPSSQKLTPPRYQDIPAVAVPEILDDDGLKVRILCGQFWGQTGPAVGLSVDPQYLDFYLPPGLERTIPVAVDRHAFAYVFEGGGQFMEASRPVTNRHLVRFDTGDAIMVRAGEQGLRFLLATGKPLGEPVAWHGPIVMNTPEEIQQAMRDLENGTFVR